MSAKPRNLRHSYSTRSSPGNVKPAFLCYDAACKLVAGLDKYYPGLLDNDGRLLRDASGHVVFPELADVGNNRDSAARDVEPCTLFEERKRTTDTEDMYAVMETATPRPGLQSEVDPHDALFWAARFSKHAEQVGERSKQSATRSLDALHRDGVRVLSLFEVPVFTYRWHGKAAGGDSGGAPGGVTGRIVVGTNGWVGQAPGGERGGRRRHPRGGKGFVAASARGVVGFKAGQQSVGITIVARWQVDL